MRTNFSDLDIRFTIGDTRFQALNIIYEKFLRTVPSHSHGSGGAVLQERAAVEF